MFYTQPFYFILNIIHNNTALKIKSNKEKKIISKKKSKHNNKQNTSIDVDNRRLQLISLLGSGLSIDDIAKRLEVSRETIFSDKREISKQGLQTLRDLGASELSFYYSTIASDNNNVKQFLWSVIKNTSTMEDDPSHYIPISEKIKASKTLIELNKELRELYNQVMTTIILPDYTKRLDTMETILVKEGLASDDIIERQEHKTKSFMVLKRPHITSEHKDNNNMNNKDNIHNGL